MAFDGTWHKRGHTSLYVIVIAIDMLTGLVVDFEIMGKYRPDYFNDIRDLGSNNAEYHVWNDSHSSE